MKRRVLIIDDDHSICELLEADLGRRGFEPKWSTSADEALARLLEDEFDVVLTDLRLPGTDGVELCRRIAERKEDLPVVVMTAFGTLESAVSAIRAGAYDFVTKPIDGDVLQLVLDRAVRHREMQQKIRLLDRQIHRTSEASDLLGDSRPLRELRSQVEKIAPTDASVLIVGESGTGKELVANTLHRSSDRRDAPFVAVNCAALPEALLESELFGHKRGAFTDARESRKGLFLQADGGTLFLDEVGDLPLALQPKLLRALEERTVRPVGGDTEEAFDVRLIAATNHDLEAAVDDGRFREDLFYRINVIQVDVPPLRARGTDVLLLAGSFLEEFAGRSGKSVTGIAESAAEKLLDYPWPGNVRELANAIERAVALTRYDRLGIEDLPRKVRDHSRSDVIVGSQNPTELVTLEEVERRYILHVLEVVAGNRSQAARLLGLDRKTLYRKLRHYKSD